LVEIGASGAYAWCYGDYDSRLFDRPPVATAIRERTFGLVRADGSEKPAAGVFRNFRKRRDTDARSGAPMRAKVAVPKVLDVTADEYYRAPGKHFSRLYAKWVEQRPL
jgi:endo-1,4-beta-mannosidase